MAEIMYLEWNEYGAYYTYQREQKVINENNSNLIWLILCKALILNYETNQITIKSITNSI